MAINLKTPDFTELKPRILVFGVGGAGGNAVNNMVSSRLEGVEFLVANTDSQALVHSKAQHRLQIGTKLTQGLGAGSRPDIGEGAAEESADEIRRILESSHMVFITAGMGGGTGTGAAPVIARIARELGILTVGVVTKPFSFEGLRRMRTAEDGIDKLKSIVDTLIVIPNQNLFRIANEKTTFAKAFEMADEVLYAGVRGVTDLMVMPGLINLDFADVRTVMGEMGTAMMGMGEAEGERRAVAAAEAAISNPLLDVSSMKGAKGVLINITGGLDLTLYEVDEAANKIRSEVDPDANIIVGSTFDERMNGTMRVSVVATGISTEIKAQAAPVRAQTATIAAAEEPRRAMSGEIRTEAVRSAPLPSQQVRAQTPSPTPSLIPSTPVQPPMADIAQPSNIPLSHPLNPQHPVHSMQTNIIRAGLAGSIQEPGTVCAPGQSGMPMVESHVFDPALVASVTSALGRIDLPQPTRMRSEPPVPQAEPRRSGGFSVFGINIGGSAPSKRANVPTPPRAASTPMPVAGRVQMEGGRASPLAGKAIVPSKEKADEILNSVADDQLDIPAFLRRQTN